MNRGYRERIHPFLSGESVSPKGLFPRKSAVNSGALLMMQRLRIYFLAVAGILVFALATLNSQQRIANIDDKVLKDAGSGTDWISMGMSWAEQRYSPMTQITPANVGKLSLAWSY